MNNLSQYPSELRSFFINRLVAVGGLFLLLALSFLSLLPTASAEPDEEASQHSPDLRFILQTQAGLTAYATLTETISLAYVRPLFTHIQHENEAYILGEYKLAGRADTVQLAIGHEGWLIAFYPPSRRAEYLYDCASFNISAPSAMPNLLHKAITEVLTAVDTPAPDLHLYDFRHPTAEGITLHWLFLPNISNRNSTITLPLDNSYLERGYSFCTSYSNSKFFLNGVIVDQQGSVSQVIHRRGVVSADQLRAGQSNTMRVEALSLFGNGFLAGVALVYEGTAEIPTSGNGYQHDFPLIYPAMLGEPLTIEKIYLPVVTR